VNISEVKTGTMWILTAEDYSHAQVHGEVSAFHSGAVCIYLGPEELQDPFDNHHSLGSFITFTCVEQAERWLDDTYREYTLTRREDE